jgi:hypothetical protein
MGRCNDPLKETERRKKIGLSKIGNKNALGYKLTTEQTKKKSESLVKAHKRKGKTWYKERYISWQTGKKVYLNTGRTWFKKGDKINLGRKHSEETKINNSEAQKITYQNGRVNWMKGKCGELHPGYKGENCKKQQKRHDSAYSNWVARIKRRDKNICQLKDENCSGYNIVHHIRGWTKYPELRYETNNGIILCRFHHPIKRKDEIKFIPIFDELIRQKN